MQNITEAGTSKQVVLAKMEEWIRVTLLTKPPKETKKSSLNKQTNLPPKKGKGERGRKREEIGERRPVATQTIAKTIIFKTLDIEVKDSDSLRDGESYLQTTVPWEWGTVMVLKAAGAHRACMREEITVERNPQRQAEGRLDTQQITKQHICLRKLLETGK